MKSLPWQKDTSPKQVDVEGPAYYAAYGDYMTSHKLADFKRSPAYFKRKHIDRTEPEPESSVFTFGRAAHVAILEGWDEFSKQFVVGDGPVNPSTGKNYGRDSKKFQDWLSEVTTDGREVVSVSEFELIKTMRQAVRKHPHAKELLKCGLAEQTIRGEMYGVLCQSRLDYVVVGDDEFGRPPSLVDLKTCGDIERFERDFWAFGYGEQMAFYAKMLAEAVGSFPEVHIVAVEKKQNPVVGVWNVSNSTLSAALASMQNDFTEYKQCCRVNDWPTRYEMVRTF